MNLDTRQTRRSILRTLSTTMVAAGFSGALPTSARPSVARDDPPLPFDHGRLAEDARLGTLLTLNGEFPFHVPETAEAWNARAEEVRRRILVAAGLWPMPTLPELIPVIHGSVERDDYLIEKVYFESFPGLYVTGNLYRPPGGAVERRPAILSPHGHWTGGRFHDHGDDAILREIETGAEQFERGGRHPLQARCVQLARMGCVVFLYDMLGTADSVPLTSQIAHGFAERSPEMSRPDRWGLHSAQAELRLQNVLGLQLLNSIRALDFLSSLPDVDPSRIAVTGASGGGTQTFLLSAVDPRPAAAFPAVMVSTSMQGGCVCENAPYLRIGTGNVEFAALFAPKPLGLTGANDWTREVETKGLPELKRLYRMLNEPDHVEGQYFDFGHNYNAQSRAMMYRFMAERLALGAELDHPIEERDYEPLTLVEASVWDQSHPKPATDEEAEVRLLNRLDADSRRKLAGMIPADPRSLVEFRDTVGEAIKVMVGRAFPEEGDILSEEKQELDRGDSLQTNALLRVKGFHEYVPVNFLYPKDYRGRVVIWVDEAGKSALFQPDGNPIRPVHRLMGHGVAVVGCDLFGQGDWQNTGQSFLQTRLVEDASEFLGYTLGYNHSLFAQRVHDFLAVLGFVRHHDFSPGRVEIIALHGAARWVAAACAVAGQVVDALALDTAGFRFERITSLRDPDLWPGVLKYGDLPALLALCAPTPLWLSGEGRLAPDLVRQAYQAAEAPAPVCDDGEGDSTGEAAVDWILDRT